MAKDWFHSHSSVNVELRLISERTNLRQYNAPTVAKVAALITNDFGDGAPTRDIIKTNKDSGLQRILELHPSYMALQYPLLFPYGEDGYHDKISYHSNTGTRKTNRGYVTMKEYYTYTPDHIDDKISAELPSLTDDPVGYKAVTDHMLLGPCGKDARYVACNVEGSILINRGLIQAIPTSLPPQLIGEETKASNLQRIPPGVQGRSHSIYFLYLISLKTQSCSEFFPLLLPEPQEDGWTDSPQELSIPRISSKRLLSKDIAHLPRPQSSLKIFTTSRKKEMNHYIKPGNGPPGYYTKTDNRPTYGERRQSLEELLAKHQEESTRRSTKMEVWIKKLQEKAEINTRNQSASLKNLETQIKQLTKELHSRNTKSEQAKVVIVKHEGPCSPKKLKNLHGISFLSDSHEENTNDQIPTKESNP
ncbi:hypothetical protein Tco_1351162 [Tanacetum coccineum]